MSARRYHLTCSDAPVSVSWEDMPHGHVVYYTRICGTPQDVTSSGVDPMKGRASDPAAASEALRRLHVAINLKWGRSPDADPRSACEWDRFDQSEGD